MRHGADLYPGQHEPLVSHELWEAVQPIRARRGEGKGGGRGADRLYLLARLARCSKCGLRLTSQISEGKGRKGHGTQNYLCPTRRRYLEGKFRRLKFLFMEEDDMSEGEYRRRKAGLQAQLDALRMPETPEVEQAGETLEGQAQEWANAPKKYRRDMLHCIFEAIFVDVEGHRLVCVKPYPPFVPLFRLDGLEEKEDGCFYPSEEES